MATPCSSNKLLQHLAKRAIAIPPDVSPEVRTPRRRPFVLINMAITADGCIATANRRITSLGSRRDRHHLYELRSTVDAVLCGARTIEESGAILDTGGDRFRRLRLRRGLSAHPIRVIASGHATLSNHAPILRPHPAPLVILTTAGAPLNRLRKLNRHDLVLAQFGRRHLDLPAALNWLYRRWHVRRLLLEGGSQLNAAMLNLGLVDELHLTICPHLFGGLNAPTLADGSLPVRLANAQTGQVKSARRSGQELYLTYDLLKRKRPRACPAVPESGSEPHP